MERGMCQAEVSSSQGCVLSAPGNATSTTYEDAVLNTALSSMGSIAIVSLQERSRQLDGGRVVRVAAKFASRRGFVRSARAVLVGLTAAAFGVRAEVDPSMPPGYVSVKDFGAKGDGVTDDTAAIVAAHAASTSVYYPRGTYQINFPESSALTTYTRKKHISIRGNNALIHDGRTYMADSISAIFSFDACADVSVIGVNYEGLPLSDKLKPGRGIGYRGATFINLKNACKSVVVNANLRYMRYGVRGGDYSLYSQGNNDDLKIRLVTVECGYPVALYLSSGVQLDIYAEGSHRSAYLAGVNKCQGIVRFKNQYIAPIQVLLTDATINGQSYPTGISRGCSDVDLRAWDMGSTLWTANSFCAGISMSRGDANTLFENISIDVYVKSNDRIASQLSAFCIYNNFTGVQKSYPNNWQQSFYFRNIKLSGVLDRSDQEVTENSSNGEIYWYTLSSGENYGTVEGLEISNFRYLPGSGDKPRGFFFVNPGLVGVAKIDNCNFGKETPVHYVSNTTSITNISNTTLRGTYDSTSDSPYNSVINFINCVIADQAFQPRANKTFTNTSIGRKG